MPHLPDHVTHDPELIAAYAAGDAAGPALDQAADLVASCTECAELHRDLRAISTALPELPAPVRPRDFRLTPEQAAALRPAGWRGVLAAFAAPRFRLAAPLGAGLAAAGLAGLLLASPGGLLPRATGEAESGSAPSAAAGAPAVQADQASGAAGAAATTSDGYAGGAALAAPEAPSPAAASAPAPAVGEKDGDGVLIQPVPAAGAAAASAAASSGPGPEFAAGLPAASPQRELAATTASGPPDATRAADAANRAPSIGPAPVEAQVEAPPASASTPWLVASGLLVLVGVALVVLRLASRRVG